MTPEQVENLQN